VRSRRSSASTPIEENEEEDVMKKYLTALSAVLLLLALGHASAEREIARTLDEWTAINPALEQYQPLHEEWEPTMGIHWGVEGPHVTLGVGYDDLVVVVEVIYPAEIGWQPWFDQPEGEPMALEGLGMVYTQHIWITEPESVQPDRAPEFLPLTLEALTEANPALERYERISDYVPQMGYHYGVMGPGLVLAVSPEGEINGFELISPVEEGWYPWFDQPEGEPMELPGLGLVYTQHLYVVDPGTLE
jgi:hypothetical protein